VLPGNIAGDARVISALRRAVLSRVAPPMAQDALMAGVHGNASASFSASSHYQHHQQQQQQLPPLEVLQTRRHELAVLLELAGLTAVRAPALMSFCRGIGADVARVVAEWLEDHNMATDRSMLGYVLIGWFFFVFVFCFFCFYAILVFYAVETDNHNIFSLSLSRIHASSVHHGGFSEIVTTGCDVTLDVSEAAWGVGQHPTTTERPRAQANEVAAFFARARENLDQQEKEARRLMTHPPAASSPAAAAASSRAGAADRARATDRTKSGTTTRATLSARTLPQQTARGRGDHDGDAAREHGRREALSLVERIVGMRRSKSRSPSPSPGPARSPTPSFVSSFSSPSVRGSRSPSPSTAAIAAKAEAALRVWRRSVSGSPTPKPGDENGDKVDGNRRGQRASSIEIELAKVARSTAGSKLAAGAVNDNARGAASDGARGAASDGARGAASDGARGATERSDDPRRHDHPQARSIESELTKVAREASASKLLSSTMNAHPQQERSTNSSSVQPPLSAAAFLATIPLSYGECGCFRKGKKKKIVTHNFILFVFFNSHTTNYQIHQAPNLTQLTAVGRRGVKRRRRPRRRRRPGLRCSRRVHCVATLSTNRCAHFVRISAATGAQARRRSRREQCVGIGDLFFFFFSVYF
jgi:hypothetical protein